MIYDNSSMFDNILPSVQPPTENDPCFDRNTAPSLDEWINEHSYLIDGEIDKIIEEICEGEEYDIKEVVEEEIDNVIYETINGDENGFNALKSKLIDHYVKKIQNNVKKEHKSYMHHLHLVAKEEIEKEQPDLNKIDTLLATNTR